MSHTISYTASYVIKLLLNLTTILRNSFSNIIYIKMINTVNYLLCKHPGRNLQLAWYRASTAGRMSVLARY